MLHQDLNTYEGLTNSLIESAVRTFNTDEYVDLDAVQHNNKPNKDNEYESYVGICTECFIVKVFDRKEMETLKQTNIIDPTYHLFKTKCNRGK